MTRSIGTALIVLVASAVAAQVPIGDVLADSNGDGIPDRLGEVVTVEGVALVDEGHFGDYGAPLFVQDETGGLAVRFGADADASRQTVAGDVVQMTGTLRFRAGAASLEVAEYALAGSAPLPEPSLYDPADPDTYEGQLVEATGTVVGRSRVTAGDALMVSLDDLSLVVVFAFRGQRNAVSYESLEAGDRVQVVGIAGQFDRTAPYLDSRQIYPRSQRDLRVVGVSTAQYRLVALGALVLVVLAVALALWFRVQVRRRVHALQASEARFDAFVERASDAVFVHGPSGAVLRANGVARKILGSDTDGAPTSLLDAVVEDDYDAAFAHLVMLRGTGHARTDLRFQRDGRQLYEVESRVVDVEGERHALSLGRSVSARRAFERGLVEARQRAEAATRAKDTFLANMSHEIRTPLTAVIGFAELLLDDVTDDQRDLVTAIEKGGRRLLSTLNSVLDLAALDARPEPLSPAPADVLEEVREVGRLLQPLASRKGLDLTIETLHTSLPATLDVDALGRVLTNLAGNAIKFTREGRVTISVDGDGQTIVLRVSDTGVGISEAFLPNLFTAFRQQSEGIGRSHEGTGLGLTISERLVHLMGGTITVDSEVGVGTTFTVTVPRGEVPVAALLADGQTAATASPMASGMAVS
ncbi:MAG: PAS domain-containing sensor histidine kinase [Bacteroidota bacterium]